MVDAHLDSSLPEGRSGSLLLIREGVVATSTAVGGYACRSEGKRRMDQPFLNHRASDGLIDASFANQDANW